MIKQFTWTRVMGKGEKVNGFSRILGGKTNFLRCRIRYERMKEKDIDVTERLRRF